MRAGGTNFARSGTSPIISGPNWSMGHGTPPFIIVLPHADTLAGLPCGDEPGEDRAFGMRGDDRNDVWQNALKPRHLPIGPLSKHPLHVDAEMNCGLGWGAVAQLVILGHGLR